MFDFLVKLITNKHTPVNQFTGVKNNKSFMSGKVKYHSLSENEKNEIFGRVL